MAAPFFRPFITLEGALAQSVPEGFLLRDLSDQSLLLPWECLGNQKRKDKMCICKLCDKHKLWSPEGLDLFSAQHLAL